MEGSTTGNKDHKKDWNSLKRAYVAIPYTQNPDRSFELACRVSADLMKLGYVVFSPISHSHPIAKFLDKELVFDHEFWMNQDLPLLQWADELHIVDCEEMDILSSSGIKIEIAYAVMKNKPIKIHKVKGQTIDYFSKIWKN